MVFSDKTLLVVSVEDPNTHEMMWYGAGEKRMELAILEAVRCLADEQRNARSYTDNQKEFLSLAQLRETSRVS